MTPFSLAIIDELNKQGRPLPPVINNATLKSKMENVNQIRMRQRAESARAGLNPSAWYEANAQAEETKVPATGV